MLCLNESVSACLDPLQQIRVSLNCPTRWSLKLLMFPIPTVYPPGPGPGSIAHFHCPPHGNSEQVRRVVWLVNGTILARLNTEGKFTHEVTPPGSTGTGVLTLSRISPLERMAVGFGVGYSSKVCPGPCLLMWELCSLKVSCLWGTLGPAIKYARFEIKTCPQNL